MVIVFTVTKYKMSQKILNTSNLLEDWTMNSNLPTTSSFMAKHRKFAAPPLPCPSTKTQAFDTFALQS